MALQPAPHHLDFWQFRHAGSGCGQLARLSACAPGAGAVLASRRAARALSCTGACRVDLLVTEGENEYVLEVNTLPGMTPTSLLPKIAAHRGMEYATLVERILDSAALHA